MRSVNIAGYFIDGAGTGGEHTGWELQTPSGEAIEVDVAQVKSDAKKCRQRFVAIRGHFEPRDYAKRGKVEVFVAEGIKLTPSSGN